MNCRSCKRKVGKATNGTCPFCGEEIEVAAARVMKTMTILVSAGQAEGVYRSVDDVPEQIRRKLLRSTSGANSGTIVIADRRGREELAKALRMLPGQHRTPQGTFAWKTAMSFSLQHLVSFALLVATLVMIALVLRYH